MVLADTEASVSLLQGFVLLGGTLVIWGVYLFRFRRMVRNECVVLLADLEGVSLKVQRIAENIDRIDRFVKDDGADGPAPA